MLSQLPNPWWVFVVLGLVAGIISGMLGLGSGTIVVPALVILCCVTQKSAQGMALAVMVPMALLGAFRYWKVPQIEINMVVVAFIVIGSLLGVLIGTELAVRLPAHLLRKFFAIFLVVIAIRMFVGSSGSKNKTPEADPSIQNSVSLIEPGGKSNE